MEKRIKCFRRLLKNWNESSQSEPGNFSLETKDANEKAYQRAFFDDNSGITEVKRRDNSILKIKWIDMEIPVVPPPSEGRNRIDLIGIVNGKDFVIAELKGHNNRTDSPLNTIRAIIKYALLAKGYRRDLVVHKNNRFQEGQNYWKHYNDCKYLIVAAPKSYWDDWIKPAQIETLKNISGNIGGKVVYSIILAKFINEDFKTKYDRVPHLQANKDNSWYEL